MSKKNIIITFIVAIVIVTIIGLIYLNGAKDNSIVTTVPSKKIEFNQESISFSIEVPENWSNINTGLGVNLIEKSPLLIISSPEDNGDSVYNYISYYNSDDDFDAWYLKHRTELINQFSEPVLENTINIDSMQARSISFINPIINEFNEEIRDSKEQFIFIPTVGKIFQIHISGDINLFSHFQKQIETSVSTFIIEDNSIVTEMESEKQIFDSYGIHDQNMIRYGSAKYDFTIDIPREFYCSLSPDVLWGANTVLCQRLNSNSSDGQDDYLFIEIFSTGYDTSQAGAFEEWYANGIAKYFARELNEVINKDVPYQLTHETMTGGTASYVYFSTDKATVSVGSAVVSEEEITEIANSFRWLGNLKSDTEDDMSDWQTFTAFDNSFSIQYPSDWMVGTPGHESIVSGERNLGIYSDNPMSSDFAMGITWSENEGISDCTSWIDKTYQDFVDEYPDMAESAKVRSYPISLLTINGQEVCRKPDVYAHDNYAEQYVITNNGLEFDIYFPNKNGGLYITDPVEKNAIAHQILNSIEFK